MSRRAVPYFFAAALAAACHGAAAQTTTTVPPDVVVQQLAPQLVAFAGSLQNFQSLVNGLAQGTPIQLTSVLPNGTTQLATFTPGSPLTPTQIAQVLESARQQLIGLGIASPTSEQIANALAGGSVPAPASATVVDRAPVSQTLQAQTKGAATGASATPPARVNTSDSPIPAGATSRTPIFGNVSNSPTPPVATPTPPPVQPAQRAQPGVAPAPRQAR